MSELDTLSRIADELTALRQNLERLLAENASLRGRLEASEAARADLQAQTEHLLQVLVDSRHLLREGEGRREKNG